MHLVATSPALAHTAWLALRRHDPLVHMIGPPGHIGQASRMRLHPMPADASRATLRRSLAGTTVFPCDERAHVRCLEADLDVVGHQDPDTLRRLADKAQYPALARAAGFRTPAIVATPAAGQTYVEKPRWGYAGEGVRQWRAGEPRAPDTILTSFIPGHDAGCNVAAVDGEVVACTAERLIAPGVRAYFRDDDIEAAAHRLVETTGFTGLLDIDLRIDDAPYVVDINPRLWCSHWMAAAVGNDIVRPYLRALHGRPPAFRHHTAVFAPPWRWHTAARHGPISWRAPFHAAAQRLADPGILRGMREHRRHVGARPVRRPAPF